VGEYGKRFLLETYASYGEPEDEGGDSVVMRVMDFVRLLGHVAILQTHAPCDDLGRPPDAVLQRLNPIALLQDVVLPARSPKDAIAAWEDDQKQVVTFSQFYALLTRLSEAVRSKRYEATTAAALDEFLHEVIVPLH
ncbi:unnamed protein product, partial [Phaeothamnion confervicola]